MLLPYTGLTYYGTGCGAGVDLSVPSADANIKANGRLSGENTSVAFSPFARMVKGARLSAFNASIPIANATLKGMGRIGAVGVIGVITQDDVTGAVWEVEVEAGKTFRQAILDLLSGGGGGGATASDIWNYGTRSLTNVSNIQSGLATSAELATLPTDTADAVWSKTLP